MVKKPENVWKDRFCKWVEEIGGLTLLIHGHGMQRPGIPDVWVGTRFWSGWIEFKFSDGKCSTAQKCLGRALERFFSYFLVRFSGSEMAVEGSNSEVLFVFPANKEGFLLLMQAIGSQKRD